MSLPVALQLYSVRDEAEADFRGTLEKVREMGYQGVEFAGLHSFTAQQVKSMVDEIGLVPISAHVALDELLSDPEAVIGSYALIGCKFIAVPFLTEERRPGAPLFAQTLSEMTLVAKECKKQGITLLYHNHDFEFIKINGEYGLDVIYNEIPADLLQTQIDTCWVNVGGENPAEYILKYSGRAPVVHLKDFVMAGKDKPQKLYELIGIEDNAETAQEEQFAFRPVGYGAQNMPAILEASEKAGAGWVVVEQDRPATGDTPMNSAKLSREYLKSLGW